MMKVDLQQLIQTLTAPTRRDLERAAELCIARGGREVLMEDLLLALMEHPEGMLVRALQDAGVDLGGVEVALQPNSSEDGLHNPVFSVPLVQWLQHALTVAQVELGRGEVDDAALVLALALNHSLAGDRYQVFLSQLDAERLRSFVLSESPGASYARAPASEQSLLQRFTHDLTRQARDGQLDPVLCRDSEIRQLIDILARRRKNNPIIVGEAGVGKTAIVEGLALRIVAMQVPAVLQNVHLLTLDMGLLQAGASIKGEFERRLKGVIDEVKSSPDPVILFIDEAHTLIGAGGQAGGSDAANLLKPALARGELRTIAATTWSEHKKYFEKDPALARRFQPVHVHEPTVADAITILRGLVPVYEASHGIYVRDDAVVAAAQLSARYLTGRQLPDKAVDVLDTACARVRISLVTVPPELQQLRDELAEGLRRCSALRRDGEAGLSIDEPALQSSTLRLEVLKHQQQALEQRWARQCELAEQVLLLRQQLIEAREAQADAEVIGGFVRALAENQCTLLAEQREQRLVSFEVCPWLVAQVINGWTGIPVTQLAREHCTNVLGFATDLGTRILGQDYAVQVLDRAMRAVASGLNRPDAPAGVFLLVGPSGVGKTETARALADLLYGGERFMTTINMSEYQEKHSLSRLIGAPPGYIGYGEGGVLTEAVRQKPYSVVLLDEVEKADPDVMNLFYQVFDKGVVNDGEGREIDFRNTLILMTSNLGSEQIVTLCCGAQRPGVGVLQEAIQPILSAHFKPALLARIRVVPYYPICEGTLQGLIESKLQCLGQRLLRRNLVFSHSPALVAHMKDRCLQNDSGARFIDHWLEANLLPLVVDRLLAAMASNESLLSARAGLDSHGRLTCEFN